MKETPRTFAVSYCGVPIGRNGEHSHRRTEKQTGHDPNLDRRISKSGAGRRHHRVVHELR